ncbi:hypothetical protein HYPBUDRAFT_113310 [Hyphopichia burtonii NRRL Y-1933]|uniref:Amino acid permease/ SLC12A domain-containing protein n=1 Tax=Hyphopichia burtonii NRRL Y-1933 TaxID=984485 RepID=A0A1E4REI5_9ASCO|nr:hypothetical protein HYPBUDRAFT_113310 [Hyphopichia burtonii NRRL Y-1933]ODV65525.1 hypothetical protein HYPBUDRAFT_113310 [Hyphopichia burtonii NRRL Y-1933]
MKFTKEKQPEVDLNSKITENYGLDGSNSLSTSSEEQPSKEENAGDQQKSIDVHRTLESRHIQLISIGGSIGSGLFITIGTSGLVNAGPLGLLLGYTFWTCVILSLTVSTAEMVCYLPVSSPFLTMAGRVVDPAFECAASVNFWFMQSIYIPFEITAVNTMIHYWRDDYSPAITVCIQIVIYILLNVFAVKAYGESEFWLSIGKLLLCIALLFFTLITMCGGNPKHDAFGFRYWHAKGGPIAEQITTGGIGRLHGFMYGLISACFTVVGPEYMSMVAGEARNPRKNMKTAFKTVLYRLALFYIGGALSVSILIAYNDPTYLEKADSSSGAGSPYVVAMTNMNVKVFPHIVNAIIVTSAFSAGNSYTYCSSRALYGLALRGFAPKFFKWCTKGGVPIYCVAVSICFAMLSLLQLGSGSASVLTYLVNLCTGSQILNYGFMCITYICFYRAVKAQGLDRHTFPYRSYLQPYTISFATFFIWIMIGCIGYKCLMPGRWSVDEFLYNYVMIFVSAFVFIVWKLWKKTKFIKASEADLSSGLEDIEEHEYNYYAEMEANEKSEGKFSNIMKWIF